MTTQAKPKMTIKQPPRGRAESVKVVGHPLLDVVVVVGVPLRVVVVVVVVAVLSLWRASICRARGANQTQPSLNQDATMASTFSAKLAFQTKALPSVQQH